MKRQTAGFGFLVAILAAALLLPVRAQSVPTLSVGAVTAEAGAGEVVVPVSITNNPGLTEFSLIVDIGRELVLNSVETGEQAGTLCSSGSITGNGTQILWSGELAASEDGVLFLLRFEEPPEGEYPLSLVLLSAADTDGNPCTERFALTEGGLEIRPSAAVEVTLYEDEARTHLWGSGESITAETLEQAIGIVADSESKIGNIRLKHDAAGRESYVVFQGVDLVLDLFGHTVEVDGADALVNRGKLAICDTGPIWGQVKSLSGSAVSSSGLLREISGGVFSGRYAILNEGEIGVLSGGFYRGTGEPFFGEVSLAAGADLCQITDERSEFYGFWQVVPAPDVTVSFYNETGTLELERITVRYGAAVTPPDPPVKQEDETYIYYFVGWYTAEEGGEPANLGSVTVSQTVYARYRAEPKGHMHIYQETVIAPTCTHQGYTLMRCDCGDQIRTDPTPTIPHQWSAGDWEGCLICENCGAAKAAVSLVVEETAQDRDVSLRALCGREVVAGGASITLRNAALRGLAARADKLTIQTDVGSLELSSAALRELLEAAAGRDVILQLERCEPVRGTQLTPQLQELYAFQEQGGVAYRFGVQCAGEPVFVSAKIVVGLPCGTGSEGYSCLAVSKAGEAEELPFSLQEGLCRVAVGGDTALVLLETYAVERPTLVLRPRLRHVNAAENLAVDLLLLTPQDGLLGELSLPIRFSGEELVYSETQNLFGGLSAALEEGGHTLLLSGPASESGYPLGGKRTLLGTLVFSVPENVRTGEAVFSIEDCALKLDGERVFPETGENERVFLWNLEVSLTAGAHAICREERAYVKYGQFGLYADRACTLPLSDPQPSAERGYQLPSACWFHTDGEETEGFSFAELNRMSFEQSAAFEARAKPVVYQITYHAQPGEAPAGNPTFYTVESDSFGLWDAIYPYGEFLGLFEDASLTGHRVTRIERGSVGDRELYAAYRAYSYSITLPPQVTLLSGTVSEGKVQAGQDVVLQITPDAGTRITELRCTVSGRPTALTLEGDRATLPGAFVTGPVVLTVRQTVDGDVVLLTGAQARLAPRGYGILRLEVASPLETGSYSYEGIPLLFSSACSDEAQGRYVYTAIVPLPAESGNVGENIAIDRTVPPSSLGLEGDVNQDGRVDLQDARLVYAIFTGRLTAAEERALTPRQRLEADLNGDGCADTDDVQKILARVWNQTD